MGMHRLLRCTALVAAILTLTSASWAEPVTPKRPDKITLATLNANYRVALEQIARSYERLHPGIRVEITIVGQGFETWIRTRFAAGGDLIPDIYNVNYTAGYQEQGRLVWIEDYLDQTNPYTGAPWRDSLDMALIERYKWLDRIYILPLDFIEVGVFYNQDIFREVGVDVPETWEEFLDTCERIRQAGYVPVAMAGNYDSFWAGTVGWMFRMFGDAYLRKYITELQALPGDWDYDPERNEGFVYNPADPYDDLMVVRSRDRMLNAMLDGTIDFRGPDFRAYHQQLLRFSRHWQRGFLGADDQSAVQLFYRGKAAMCVLTSSHVTGIVRDFRRLDPEDRFDYGVFWFPPITEDPLVCGPFRGVGGGGVMLSATQKNDPAHEANVIDFLMYLTSPEAGRMLIEETLAADQPLLGPLVIKGVEMPPELAERYAPFLGRGFEKINFRGLEDEQESSAEWTVIAQEWLGGRLTLDEYLERYQALMLAAIPRLQARFGIDLDPATEDLPPTITADDRRAEKRRNLWNPFQNGLLAVALIAALFVAFGAWHASRPRGAARRTTLTAYALLAPTFLLLGVFSYFPAASGLYHAFTDWEEGRGALFNGLDNFRRLAGDATLWYGAGNMAILLIAGLFKSTVVPFIAAELILCLYRDRLRYLFRTGFLVPMVAPGMVAILLWRFIYDPNMGLLNEGLRALGLSEWTRSWLGEPHLALPAIIFMGFPWIGALGLLIYMAGLMNIPQGTHEAFRLESGNILRRIIAIDAPLVRGQTRLLVILTFIGSLQDFQSVLIMTGGGPGIATMVPALRMYHMAFRFSHFGYAAAIGFVLFLAILIITMINLRVLKSAEEL